MQRYSYAIIIIVAISGIVVGKLQLLQYNSLIFLTWNEKVLGKTGQPIIEKCCLQVHHSRRRKKNSSKLRENLRSLDKEDKFAYLSSSVIFSRTKA